MKGIAIVSATLGALLAMSSSSTALADGGALPNAHDAPPSTTLDPAGEMGLFLGIVPGVGGELRNPALQITPGLAFAMGGALRFHFTFAYSRIGEANGFDLRPLTIGIPLRISRGPDFGFAVEPLVDLLGMQGLFGNGAGVLLFSSGFGVQAVLTFKASYLSVAPLNFQFNYFGVITSGGSGSGGGFGLNMPIRLSGGLRF